jgi:hypothetical protein
MRRIRFIVALLVGTAATSVCLGQVNLDEEVTFYGPYLFWDRADNLTLFLRGRFYEPEKGSVVRKTTIDRVVIPSLFRVMEKRPDEFDEDARALMAKRLTPFFWEGESDERLKVRLVGAGGAETLELPKTDRGGHFAVTTATAGMTRIADLVGAGRELQVQVVVPDTDTRRFVARLTVPPRRLPLLVVSDVDDTVRIAEVTNRARLIERVFLHRYEPVPAMSNLYRQLAERGAAFHFVSGSPWQIAPLIDEMLQQDKFPPAVLHCRQMSWDFWNSDEFETKQFKVGEIEKLLEQFASRKVLLIGDDGEHDPEVYSEICRKHPDRVAGVWIHRVRETWDATRLDEPTKLLGLERAVAFEHAGELKQAVEKLNSSRISAGTETPLSSAVPSGRLRGPCADRARL